MTQAIETLDTVTSADDVVVNLVTNNETVWIVVPSLREMSDADRVAMNALSAEANALIHDADALVDWFANIKTRLLHSTYVNVRNVEVQGIPCYIAEATQGPLVGKGMWLEVEPHVWQGLTVTQKLLVEEAREDIQPSFAQDDRDKALTDGVATLASWHRWKAGCEMKTQAYHVDGVKHVNEMVAEGFCTSGFYWRVVRQVEGGLEGECWVVFPGIAALVEVDQQRLEAAEDYVRPMLAAERFDEAIAYLKNI